MADEVESILHGFTGRLGKFFRLLREEWGGSQDAAAEASGVSQGEISRIERGETLPTMRTIFRLLRAYSTRTTEFEAQLEHVISIALDQLDEDGEALAKHYKIASFDDAEGLAIEANRKGNVLEGIHCIIAGETFAANYIEKAKAKLWFGAHLGVLGNYFVALRYFNEAQKLLQSGTPQNAEEQAQANHTMNMVLANKAEVFLKQGLLDDADALFTHVQRREPTVAGKNFCKAGLGRVESRRHNFPRAIALLRESVDGYDALGADHASMKDHISVWLAEALHLSGSTDDAIAIWGTVLDNAGPESDPSDLENFCYVNLLMAIYLEDRAALARTKRAAVEGQFGEVADIIAEFEESKTMSEQPVPGGVFRWKNALLCISWPRVLSIALALLAALASSAAAKAWLERL